MAIDHEYTNEIVCPYCGAEFSDSLEFGDDDYPECEECGKKFISRRDISVSYITKKSPCLNGEEPHIWRSISIELSGNVLFKHRYVCIKCTTERGFPGETRTEFEAFDETHAGYK
jgi:DNA-directed RNA polymerase subunit RPC12/RpoP